MQIYLLRQFKISLKLSSVILALALTLMMMITGCNTTNFSNSSRPKNSNSASNKLEPSSLKIIVLPVQSKAKQDEQLKGLADYLSKSLNLPVSFQVAPDFIAAENLMVEEKVQIGFLGPTTYVRARQRNPQIEAIAAPISTATHRPWYKAVIVVNPASGIKTLNDLKYQRIGFVNKLATTGYIVQILKLTDIGMNLHSDFTSIQFYGRHDRALVAMASGQVDAVGVSIDAYTVALQTGKLNSSNSQLLWESDPIPGTPVVSINRKLSDQFINRLKLALIAAPDGLLDNFGTPSDGYTLVQDSDYDPIRQMEKQLELKKLR